MPITLSLITNLFFFGFTLWLGGYLVAYNSQKMTVSLTGWGVILCHCSALEIIWDINEQSPACSCLLWIGAALHLIPEDTSGGNL
jgi:hypothetical protein